MSTDESVHGYVLHNLATGQDTSTASEADALAATHALAEDHDWSLWKVHKDGSGEPEMVAVGTGPAGPPDLS